MVEDIASFTPFLTAISSVGFTVWYSYYLTTKVGPTQHAEHIAAIKSLTSEHISARILLTDQHITAINKMMDSHQLVVGRLVDELREQRIALHEHYFKGD